MTILKGARAPGALLRVRFAGLIALLGLLGLLSGCTTTTGGAAGHAFTELEDGQEPPRSGKPETGEAASRVAKRLRGSMKPYVVRGKRYYPKARARGHVEQGMASWYGRKFHGRRTSNGERYDMYAMTAAHKTLPLPSYVEVKNLKNGRQAIVRVNDRGPFHDNRVIDLSYAAAKQLGVLQQGTALVQVRVIDPSDRGRLTEPENPFVVAADPPKTSRVAAATKQKPQPEPAPTRIAAAPAPARPSAKAAPAPQPAPATAVREPLVAAAEPVAAKPESRTSKTSASSALVYLQVGAFGSRSNAEQLRRQLMAKLEEDVFVRATDFDKNPLYKVRVGPLDSDGKADDLSQQLAALGLPKSHVVRE